MTTRPSYVYILRNKAGEPIYVGCTSDLPARRNHHRRWYYWHEVASWDVYGPFRSRSVALARELDLIRSLRPHYNRAGLNRTHRDLSPIEAEAETAQHEYNGCFRYRQVVVDDVTFARCRRRLDRALAKLARERASARTERSA